jgi:diguanylate cyclase (GGDEF)-like protein/PAS domain S-box-containing protein
VRPADLLRTVERVRALGWGVALDDVGAEVLSLAFMPLLRPDVVKLDLRLVQDRPGPQIAEIMNAVNAYAERSGALILAEGIETPAHLRTARALGARLGQGWLLGRPGPGATAGLSAGELVLPSAPAADGDGSPFDCLPAGTPLRRSPKDLLIELSKQLEREAMRIGKTCVVASTFQEAQHFTVATTQRYRDLVDRTSFVCALGEGLPVEPVPGVRGADLSQDDPVRGEWDVVVIGPHFAAALLARDLGDSGPDLQRTFEYALTYDRDTVVRAGVALLGRVAPRVEVRGTAAGDRPAPRPAVALPALAAAATGAGEALLSRALAATSSGVTIADMTRPDQPLVFVNAAFEQLSGYSSAELLGRNCRFLQGSDTDPGAVARLRAAIAEGRECRETLLNLRGTDGSPWWNEVFLAPVHDERGRLVQYIGVQHDVTARIEAERALLRERDRAQGYLARIEQLAFADPLTGLANRRRLEERVEAALLDAQLADGALALVFLDLDGFKAINDRHGHAAGDQVLVRTAQRLTTRLRRSDVLARLGGDEFLIALPGLDPATAARDATALATSLAAVVAQPLTVAGHDLQVRASLGTSHYPADGASFGALLHVADQRMYATKHADRVR